MNRWIQFYNRIGGIIIWVGLWNLIVLLVPEDSLIGNIFLVSVGLVVWIHTNEFDQPDIIDETSIEK